MTIVRKHKRKLKKGYSKVKSHKRKVRKQMPILYHGTHIGAALIAENEGLKSTNKSKFSTTSDKSNPDYTYFFKDVKDAKTYAGGVSKRIGLPPSVLEVDVPEKGLKRDFGIAFGEAYMRKGGIPKDKLKRV